VDRLKRLLENEGVWLGLAILSILVLGLVLALTWTPA
jgi:hypothetical protein